MQVGYLRRRTRYAVDTETQMKTGRGANARKPVESCTRVESDPGGAKWALPRVDSHREMCLSDRDALDIEDQVRVGRDVRGSALLAVSHRGRDSEATLAASSHASDTNIPTLDDLAGTELEREWLALLVGCMIVSSRQYAFKNMRTYSQRPCRSAACRCSASRRGHPSWQPCPCPPSCHQR